MRDLECEVNHVKETLENHKARLDEHEERLDSHDARLAHGDTSFAVIKNKLNMIIAILATIGAAVAGAIVNQILH
jgi:hypothetical protein